MEDWVILTKFITLVYFGIKFSTGDMKNTALVVLSTLAYVSINMIYHMLKRTGMKALSSAASILLLAGCSAFLSPLFTLLLPMNIIELMYGYRENIWFPATALSVVLFLADTSLIPEYSIAASLSLMIFLLCRRHYGKLAVMSKELDDLRERNFRLSESLARDTEFERQVKYSSQLEERNKIAQEIHDRLGHSISGSLMQLEASKLLIGNEPDKAQAMVQNVIITLREGMESIRSTLRNIKPAPEQLGINRIKLFVNEFSMNAHVKINLVYKGNIEVVTNAQWKVILENIQEALTNAAKYSRASVINISIDVLNKLVKAEVRDNGIGAASIRKGLGIAGMEERSENMGGKVIVDGSKGFSVITLLPVDGEVS